MATTNTKNKLNYRFILKERNALLWLILLLFFVVLVVFLDSLKPSNFSVSYLDNEDKNDEMKGVAASNVGQTREKDLISVWKSFGDNFSSSVYLDKERSDMFLDDITTALVFPPLYSWNKKEDCFEPSCGLGPSIRSGNFLFEKKEINYLADFKKMPQPLPIEIINKNIVAASLYGLGSRQIASFVFKEGEQERGMVYFIEDEQYLPLINNETKQKILTKYGKGGGYIAVGGEENNFLIFYAGYEINAFHYNNGELVDISRFFGLRVANNGFYPYIIKQGKGSESIWYILSLEKNNHKLIKLWQNNTTKIKGSLDLSSQLNWWLKKTGGTLKFVRSGSVKGEIDFIVENENGNYSLWAFIDEGFDNSKNRQAVSINLNEKNFPILKAQIRSLGVSINDYDDGEYASSFSHPKLKVYLGDSLDNFLPAELGKIIKFNGDKEGVYWKIELEKGNKNDYSPWLDHVNDLQYLVYL